MYFKIIPSPSLTLESRWEIISLQPVSTRGTTVSLYMQACEYCFKADLNSDQVHPAVTYEAHMTWFLLLWCAAGTKFWTWPFFLTGHECSTERCLLGIAGVEIRCSFKVQQRLNFGVQMLTGRPVAAGLCESFVMLSPLWWWCILVTDVVIQSTLETWICWLDDW